jgi:hypothetical protein
MPSDAKTPPPALSRSPSPPGSPSEVSSRRPRSPVSSHRPRSPVFFVDTSRDFDFAQQLYGELNRGFLGPPCDDKIIILNDSDEEKEEVREKKSTGAKDAVGSAVVNPAPTTSADTDDAPAGAKNGNSDEQGPDQEAISGNGSGDDAGEP